MELCKICKTGAPDFICHNCDNEYAEWLEEQGLVVGVFDDPRHPGYVAEPHKGTKWEALEN